MTWAARRERYWSTHDRRCARCGTFEDVLLHHADYSWPLGEEPDHVLAPMCRRCHLALHQLHRRRPNRDLERLTRRFVRWGRFMAQKQASRSPSKPRKWVGWY